jgi:hypothetical protein
MPHRGVSADLGRRRFRQHDEISQSLQVSEVLFKPLSVDRLLEAIGRVLPALTGTCRQLPRESVDETPEILEVHGFHQAAGRLQPFRNRLRLVVRRQDDDRNATDIRARELGLAELLARHDRHHQVEDDQGGVTLPREVVRLHSVSGCDDAVPGQRKHRRKHLTAVVIILDQQNRSAFGHRQEFMLFLLAGSPAGTRSAPDAEWSTFVSQTVFRQRRPRRMRSLTTLCWSDGSVF